MLTLLWLLGATPLIAQESIDARSLRTVELLRRECFSTLGRQELTLFANGTVRLREGLPGEEVMRLLELGRDEVAAYVRRLEKEDLSETERLYRSVDGAWVEQCELVLALPGQASETYGFGRYDTLSLALQRVENVVRELVGKTGSRAAVGTDPLPAGYEPRIGDVLKRVDGARFEVMAFTGDGGGVELQGLLQPLTLYVPKGELAELFVALESTDE